MLDRRMMLAGLAGPLLAPAALAEPSPLQLLAGTYRREGGRGMVRIAYQPPSDRTDVGFAIPATEASYGVRSPRWNRRYVVHEAQTGAVTALDASCAVVGSVPTGGAGPCFLALDANQGALAVANYDSGSVSLIRLDPGDGRPLGPAQVVAHRGSGPVGARQAGPHAHWVGFSPDGHWLHSVDLGADAIFAHPYDAAAVRIGEGQVAYAAPPGSGPRHLVRHPRLALAYLVSELDNSLTVLAVQPEGRFAALQRLSTLPDEFTGHNQAAHIFIDAEARRLYVSNRGANTLAVFALDPAGRPSLVQQIGSGGDWPRFFLFLERDDRVLVANERSGQVAILHRGADGRLTDGGGRMAVPGVVFLMT